MTYRQYPAVAGRTIRKRARKIRGKSVGFVHLAFQAKKNAPKGPANLGDVSGSSGEFQEVGQRHAPDAMPRTAVPSRNPIRNVVRALSESRGIIRRDACHPVQYLFAIMMVSMVVVGQTL
jgi:hypothetical protein